MAKLKQEKCVPCGDAASPASPEETKAWMRELTDWTIETIDGIPQLTRTFKFKTYRDALAFTARVGDLAEANNHHPAIVLEWGRVTVRWWTHKVKNVHRNDFIMAAKTDALPNGG